MSFNIKIQPKVEERKSVPEGKNRILELATREIVYVPKLKNLPLVKSINACLLMQQLDFRFHHYPDGFYKFQAPCENQYAYKEEDSWTEELGMSVDMFRTAFDQVGIRYKDKKSYDKAVDKFQGKYYCSYSNKITRKTYYFRNHQLLDDDLETLFLGDGQSQSIEIDNVSSVEAGIPNSESTKNTTKNTTKKTTIKERDKNASPNYENSRSEEKIKLSIINKDFTPSRDMILWAGINCYDVDIPKATEKFLDYYKSNLKKSADWVAEWRIWMRREADYLLRHGLSQLPAEYPINYEFDVVMDETRQEIEAYFENGHFPMRVNELRQGFPDLSVESFDYLTDTSYYACVEIIDGYVYSLMGNEKAYKPDTPARAES